MLFGVKNDRIFETLGQATPPLSNRIQMIQIPIINKIAQTLKEGIVKISTNKGFTSKTRGYGG